MPFKYSYFNRQGQYYQTERAPGLQQQIGQNFHFLDAQYIFTNNIFPKEVPASLMASRIRRGFVLLQGENPTFREKLPFFEGTNTVGRNPAKSNITIKDRSISEVHARLICKNSTIWVVDEKSKNGVYLNSLDNLIDPEKEIMVDPKKDVLYFAKIKCTFDIDWLGAIYEDEDETKQFVAKSSKTTNAKPNPEIGKEQKSSMRQAKQDIPLVKKGEVKMTSKQIKTKELIQENKDKLCQADAKKTRKAQAGIQDLHKQGGKDNKQAPYNKNSEKEQSFPKSQKIQKPKPKKESKQKTGKTKEKPAEKQKTEQQAQKKQSLQKKEKIDSKKTIKQTKQQKGQDSKEARQSKKEAKQQPKKKNSKQKVAANDPQSKQRIRKTEEPKPKAEERNDSGETKVRGKNKKKAKSVGKNLQTNVESKNRLTNRKIVSDLNQSFNSHPKRPIIIKNALLSNCSLSFTPTVRINIVENWRDSFDVLVMEKYSRTFKLLYSICLGLPIVSLNWIMQSEYRRGIVPYDRFFLQGPLAEKDVIRKSVQAVKDGGSVFKGMKFYLVEVEEGFHLALEQVEALIEAGGGQVLKKIQKKSEEIRDVIFIVRLNHGSEDWKALKKLEGAEKVYTIELIMDSCLHQEIDWESNRAAKH